MKVRVPIISFALMAIVVACNKPSPVAEGASTITTVPSGASDPAPMPSGGAPVTASGSSAGGTQAPASPAILAAFQGRWGLTPQDCTTALGDAKGLLVISGGEVRFYESRAIPAADAHVANGILTGNFHFAGEGQTWTRFERFERDKDVLVRTESDPAASFTYAKC